MKLINQPFDGQLGNYLAKVLESSNYQEFNVVVAFAKNSGVLRIKNAIDGFRKRGGKVNIYVWLDMGGTSYEALTNLLTCSDSLNIVHTETEQTFHSKMYQFLGKDKGILIVGSNNLTGGGLWTNFETAVIVQFDDIENKNLRLSDYFQNLHLMKESLMVIQSQKDIDKLLEFGYISKEIQDKINNQASHKTTKYQNKIFSKSFKAQLPKINEQDKQDMFITKNNTPKFTPINLDDNNKTIWFETRKMTGGSRNILDLSKTSLIEKRDVSVCPDNNWLTKGAVEFFDLNPSDATQTKDIVINFDGVDYNGNTILYPTGENANGTWRLQIKGVSASNRKITEAFKAKTTDSKYYLVHKIITFTKINTDYYFMSVLPDSELEKFKEFSLIVARNGSSRTSKYMGIL